MNVTAFLFALGSCTEGVPSAPRRQSSPAESPAFFAAALAHFTATAQAPVVVDPRPLRPGAMLHSVRESALLPGADAVVRLRTRVASSAGLRTSDATEDWKCVFSAGLRGPAAGTGSREDSLWAARRAQEPDSLRARREACLARGEFVSVAFGLPQAETDPQHPGRWRIRSIRMLLHGWEVVDLFLEARPGGDWQVVAEQTRVGAFS
ncbi:hypothetical protein [Longimicrobium sp.]|uniref:hypothetical protein n=1 Tax=Longimicrobium sp. TaxID=2029185 RepID=UPI003B3BADBF